jgi:ESCRT-II complex subunit VPS25
VNGLGVDTHYGGPHVCGWLKLYVTGRYLALAAVKPLPRHSLNPSNSQHHTQNITNHIPRLDTRHTMATVTATATATESSFTFPREYHFPAFFTRQTNLTTLHAQRNKWADLILAYARHNRIFRLSLSEAADSDLFVNRKLDRRLQFDDIRDVVSFMHADGRVEYVGGGTSGDVVFLYWRKPEEWAELVENYVEETGQKGSVLTVYELVEGDGTKGNGRSNVALQCLAYPSHY